MTDEQHRDDPQVGETQATLDEYLEHAQVAPQSALNLRWDEVEFRLHRMETIAETAAASVKPYIDALHEPIRGFVLGFRQWMTGETPEDKDKALGHFIGARNALRKLRTEQRELTNNPGFVQFALGIESQILSVQEGIARARDDANEAARLAQQRDHLLDEAIATFDPDDPMRHFLEATKQLQEAMPKFLRGNRAFLEMNLDLAQEYLEESSKAFSEMQDHFGKAKLDATILKASKNLAEGFRLFASAQDIYVRTLRAAIIGDVHTTDVKALEKAERAFLDGASRVSEAGKAMPGLLGGLNLEPLGRQASQLTHNLRTLCERSLSPKEITRATAPRVVFYFLGTFLILLIALPISGLVTELQSNDMGLLLIVALVVSLIGAFGFEAVRFVPLFKEFTRVLPWARQSQEGSGKEP